jgi:simple sugar transport system ATP-binding protein
LYINEDLDELMQVSDRIGVIHEGELVDIFEQDEFDKYEIGSKMIGG